MSKGPRQTRAPACQAGSAPPPRPSSGCDAPTTRSSDSPAFRGLRQPGVLREIRFSLFEKGVFALASFLSHVEEPRCIAGKLLNPGESVRVSIECGLQEANRG